MDDLPEYSQTKLGNRTSNTGNNNINVRKLLFIVIEILLVYSENNFALQRIKHHRFDTSGFTLFNKTFCRI